MTLKDYEKYGEVIDKEVRIKLKDNSVFSIEDEERLSALRMKLDIEGLTVEEFIYLFTEEVEKHWIKKTIPTKFPWDLSWKGDLRSEIWDEWSKKFENLRGNEIKKRLGRLVGSLIRKDVFEDEIKVKKAKKIKDGVAVENNLLILRSDTEEAKIYWDIHNKFTDKVRKNTEKELAERKDEAKNRFKNQAELAQEVFYQYIRPYLMGILLNKLTKGKSYALVTSRDRISVVGKDKLMSKKLMENEQ